VTEKGDVTRLLADYVSGNSAALEKLLPLVYDELRRVAAGYMRRESEGHTLQATALVHEAYFRMIDQNQAFQNRSHFLGVAAQMMRRILVDHARGKRADKRGGDAHKIDIEEAIGLSDAAHPDLVKLDDALKELAKVDERQSRIVELRYFGGLEIEEVAEVLNISPATVKRDWTVAKAWLKKELV